MVVFIPKFSTENGVSVETIHRTGRLESTLIDGGRCRGWDFVTETEGSRRVIHTRETVTNKGGNAVIRKMTGLFIALALVVGASGAALAADAPVLSRIVKAGELRVGMSGNQPPFSMKSKTNTLIGFEVDLATLLANAMGVELTLVEKPFGELLAALDAGEVDMVMSGMTMTPERNLRAAFVGPYMVSGKSILTKSATLAAIEEAEDIDQSQIKLTALAGSTSEKFVKRVLPKAQLTAVKDYDEAVAAVLGGGADAMVADFPICALTILRHPDAGLATLAQPLTIEPIGVALPAGDSLLLNMVENYLGALEGIGLLDELEAKWFDDGSWLIQIP
jgi:polar amino acid transport system substrate-binding protein